MPQIMIADGEKRCRDTYRDFFFLQGWSADVVADALSCLESLKRARPDLLVVDTNLQWGGADGLLSCLRERVPDVPVLLTTTAVGPVVELSLPASHILVKPFGVLTLWDRIRWILSAGNVVREHPAGLLKDSTGGPWDAQARDLAVRQ